MPTLSGWGSLSRVASQREAAAYPLADHLGAEARRSRRAVLRTALGTVQSSFSGAVVSAALLLAPGAAWAQDSFSSSTSTDSSTTTTTTTTSEAGSPPSDTLGSDPSAAGPSSFESSAAQAPSNQCVPSCTGNSECINGKCEHVCRPACDGGEVCTESGQCERLGKVGASFTEAAKKREERKREVGLVGVRGLAGLVVGGGLTVEAFEEWDGDGLDGPVNSGNFYSALKLGMTIDLVELSAEWAPFSYLPVIGNDESRYDNNDVASSLLFNIGVHMPLAERISWVLRVGGGVTQTEERNDFTARLDIFGISVKTKYVLFDVSLPSIRYTSDFDTFHRFSGMVGLSASYITP